MRLVDEYKYTANTREKYCRLTPVQKYNLAMIISRDVRAGVKPGETKKTVEREFKRMKGDV